MKTKSSFERIKQSWEAASKELGFEIVFDFEVDQNGRKSRCFALVPEFGSKLGTYILLRNPPEGGDYSGVIEYAKKKGAHFSVIYNEAYSSFERSNFVETMNDWGYFGKGERPKWMSEPNSNSK
jgi:hypothetical protein